MPVPTHLCDQFCICDDDDDCDADQRSVHALPACYDLDWTFPLPAAPAAPILNDNLQDPACAVAPSASDSAFCLVWDLLYDLDVVLGDMAFNVATRYPELQGDHKPVPEPVPKVICLNELCKLESNPVTLKLDELLSKDVLVSPSECKIASGEPNLSRLSKLFESAFYEFAGDIYNELEIGFEPYFSAGFIQSCFAVQFDVLDELCAFAKPTCFEHPYECPDFDT
jgi:hypothetical protein